MGNWANLPIDLLDEMVARVNDDIIDFIRFGCVCRSWRSASLESNHMKKTWGDPWLMVSDNSELIFIDVSTKKFRLKLPKSKFMVSSSGWLVNIHRGNNTIHLLNPLTRRQISLPPYKYNAYLRPMKFAFSSASDSECVVMRIDHEMHQNCGCIAFARPGDKAWTTIHGGGSYKDIIFFNNLFYAIEGCRVLRVCDLTTHVPKAIDLLPLPELPCNPSRYNLVDISGNLHLVAGFTSTLCTVDFQVYKLDFSKNEWIKLQELGDHALFLGKFGGGFAVSTSNHPGLRANSIYFTYGTFDKLKCNMELFDFGEKKLINLFYHGETIRTPSFAAQFFMPNLH